MVRALHSHCKGPWFESRRDHMKKVLLILVGVAFLSLGFLTVNHITPISPALGNPIYLSNFIQRVLGLSAFTMLFVVTILGVFLDKISKKLGGWIFNFYIYTSVFAYILVLLHPIMYLSTAYFAVGKFDPYAAFVNVCLLCRTPGDFYLTLGRVSFWFVSIAVFALVFRNTFSWLKTKWKNTRVLNSVAFLLAGTHGFLLGVDFKEMPFYAFAIAATAIVLAVMAFIEIPLLYKNFISWVES